MMQVVQRVLAFLVKGFPPRIFMPLAPQAPKARWGAGYTGSANSPRREPMTTIPPSFHDDAHQGLQGPWTFLKETRGGGFTKAGMQLMLAWACAAVIPAWFWARHVASFAGRSALANHWGERLALRDLLELWWNGKWEQDPFGFLPRLALLVCLSWALWAGWQMQAEVIGQRPTAKAWVLGFFEAVLIGVAPLGFVYWIIGLPISGMGGLGIAPFSWAAFLLKPLFFFAFMTALSVQWSICRVRRLAEPQPWMRHLGHSFLGLWTFPIQWTVLALSTSLLRMALSFGVLALAWRWGGISSSRVAWFAVLQGLVAAGVAWTLGWQLRLAGRFAQHDAEVRAEQIRLSSLPAAEEVVSEA
jgi:hypothetical protein